jgi:hypothetical protein
VGKKRLATVPALSPAEQRAARSEHVRVFEAEPYGWIAFSEQGGERNYHLYLNPETKRLVCTCGDYIFRANDHAFECKHITATLKFIARRFLARDYDPHRQNMRAA